MKLRQIFSTERSQTTDYALNKYLTIKTSSDDDFKFHTDHQNNNEAFSKNS